MIEAEGVTRDNSLAGKLSQVFRRDGDQLRLDDPRLKARNKMDAARRLMYLHLLASSVLNGQPSVGRQDLIAAAKDVNLYDSNFGKLFNDRVALAAETDEIRLTRPGRQEAERYLEDILDEAVPDTWPLGSTPRSRGTRPSSGGEPPESPTNARRPRKTSTRTSRVKGWVDAWKAEPLVDGHAAVRGKPVADKGMIALWAIRKTVGDEDKEVGTAALSTFIQRAFEDKVHKRSLERALKQVGQGKIIPIDGTKFQITPTGMTHVEEIIGYHP